MKEIEKALKKQLALCLFLTVGFAAGIPAIVLGAVNKLWIVMAAGIAFTVIGFYGMPVGWTVYGNKKELKRVVYAVKEEHLLTVSEIASQLRKSEPNVRGLLDTCFRKNYLSGYVRKGDALAVNEAAAAEEILHAEICPFCGAKFTYKGAVAECPYCGSAIENRK